MGELLVRVGRGRYRRATRDEVQEAASRYAAGDLVGVQLTSAREAQSHLSAMLADRACEIFAMVLLDQKHRVISVRELFRGTIDSASVHPREVVRETLEHDAAAVIFAHNHPSGSPEPSAADKHMTARLKEALALIDVRVLDHILVTRSGCVSFAERGLL